MAQPTSTLLTQILNFAQTDERVQKALLLRDNHHQTWGSDINCKLYKINPNYRNLAAYLVEFRYITRNDIDERSDDVSVFIEVNHQATPTFKILDIRFY